MQLLRRRRVVTSSDAVCRLGDSDRDTSAETRNGACQERHGTWGCQEARRTPRCPPKTQPNNCRYTTPARDPNDKTPHDTERHFRLCRPACMAITAHLPTACKQADTRTHRGAYARSALLLRRPFARASPSLATGTGEMSKSSRPGPPLYRGCRTAMERNWARSCNTLPPRPPSPPPRTPPPPLPLPLRPSGARSLTVGRLESLAEGTRAPWGRATTVLSPPSVSSSTLPTQRLDDDGCGPRARRSREAPPAYAHTPPLPRKGHRHAVTDADTVACQRSAGDSAQRRQTRRMTR